MGTSLPKTQPYILGDLNTVNSVTVRTSNLACFHLFDPYSRCLKNSVIGSNRQKGHVIAQGIVPRLLQLVGDNMMPMQIKVEATVTLGSLAKGTEDHVKALVDLNIVPVLINGECDIAHWQIKVYSLFCLLQAFPLQQLLVKG